MYNILFIIITALFLASCGSDSENSGSNTGKNSKTSVSLFLGKMEMPLFDSISVHISALDMESIHITEVFSKENLKIEGISEGANRKFEVKIYADGGKLIQEGEATADIKAGEITTIPIVLNVLFGFLKLEVPLGIVNNTGVNSGKLYLDSFEFDMKIENGKGIFNTGALPANQNFKLRIELENSSGDILFTGSDTFMLSSLLQTKTIQLKSTKGSAVLELKESSDNPNQIIAMLPESAYGFREPQNYSDLFFTEIFADPKVSGTDYQYMEIYNATSDTLLLSSCTIARDRSNSPTGGKLNMPSYLSLPPMKYIVLGRDSVSDADYNYKTFSLLMSGQSMVFYCGGTLIDSLYYSKDSLNYFPLIRGTPMQLPLENYANRIKGSSWCFGSSKKQDAECE